MIRKLTSLLFVAFISLALTGCTSVDTSQVQPNSSIDSKSAAPATPPKTEIKEDSKVEVVPFSIKEENSVLLYVGDEKVLQEGKDGSKTIIFEVQYSDGKEISRKKTDEVITSQSTDKIIQKGTKVRPVVAPAPIPPSTQSTPTTSAPSDATARCKDGTYSYSQNHSGTCSHHGGVAQWLD